MATSLFDRVAGLVEEIGAEKRAAVREKTAGSKNMGNSSHPSENSVDDDEQDAVEGFQSADNTRAIKDKVPESVDSKPDATEGNAPKATDNQLGQGVDAAKPVGEDPAVEDNYKGTLEGDKRQGDRGGTSHPATGSYGEKYSSDRVARMSSVQLLKSAADLGTEIAADLANGLFNRQPQQAQKQAAVAGQQTAAVAGQVGDQMDKLASDVVQEIVKSAYHQADLVVDHLAHEMAMLKRAEGENEAEDPTGGASEGEDFGSEDAGGEAGGGDAQALMAAMGGAGGAEGGMPPGAEGGMPPGAEGGMPPGMEGEMPPEAMGGMPPGAEGGEAGGPPPEMGAMGNEQALQQLAMALMEAGIDPRALAAAVPEEGGKIASAVMDFQRSGMFEYSEAKRGSAERKVRDYMKGFITELYRRSR